MKSKILFVNPPFTQLNTPYPATAYLKGFLNTLNIHSEQMDLGIETILRLFSVEGISEMFLAAETKMSGKSANAQRIFSLRKSYIDTVAPVIIFLQDQDPTLAHLICERNFLPEAAKFSQLEDIEWAFGTMGIKDKARHLATLYLEDISDFIVEVVDSHFGFSRYAEKLGISATSFDPLYEELHQQPSLITELMLECLKRKVDDTEPELVCISVPFPGNLFSALQCGKWIKKTYPNVKIAMGGGYPNTELRSVSDARLFEFIDFICLDDGEAPMVQLLAFLENESDSSLLKRTFMLVDGEVSYCNANNTPDIKQEKVGTPDYDGLPLKKYLSVIQLTNPMHRLWSDGRWNKLTMAHGCYWGKCTFCDISLDYIGVYEASSAATIVDRMEQMIEQTGERGFHFVDEAAPPSLMKAVALQILKRKLVVTWWTNIRFEKSFHADLCLLLAKSGCIAVSGGLEVASDRLLELIAKGVTVEQVAKVNDNFNKAGIMVHAYLMYGFPSQTAQETVDSLEVVRQMFEQNVMQSAFWHRFSMTAHSPVGIEPEMFQVESLMEGQGSFANNDLVHADPTGTDHGLFSEGLKKSLYNYMHGVCLDWPLSEWFDHKVPRTSLAPDLIESYLASTDYREMKPSHLMIWIGGAVSYDSKKGVIKVHSNRTSQQISCTEDHGKWLEKLLHDISPSQSIKTTYKAVQADYEAAGLKGFLLFWYSGTMDEVQESGLLVL